MLFWGSRKIHFVLIDDVLEHKVRTWRKPLTWFLLNTVKVTLLQCLKYIWELLCTLLGQNSVKLNWYLPGGWALDEKHTALGKWTRVKQLHHKGVLMQILPGQMLHCFVMSLVWGVGIGHLARQLKHGSGGGGGGGAQASRYSLVTFL